MDFFESGNLSYHPHYGWDYGEVTEYTYSRYSDAYKGLAILKTVPPYASEAQVLDKFHYYAIVGGDGTPLTIDQSGVYSINAWGMEHSIVKRGEGSEVYYNTTLYEVVPTHALPYPQAPDYWDGNLFLSASLPIFNIDTQAGLDAFNLYQTTGDYSGADNYNDLPHDADTRKEIYFNTMKIQGIKGYKGNVGICDVIPVGAMIAYDGDDLPEGYEETTDPTQ